MANLPRSKWSRLHLPAELVDLVKVIAAKHGYRDQEHKFVFHLLKSVYPEDVQLLSEYLEADWLDEPPKVKPEP